MSTGSLGQFLRGNRKSLPRGLLEARYAEAPAAASAAAPAEAPPEDQGLCALRALRDEGVLTDAEFAAKKALMRGAASGFDVDAC